ncbi:DUF2322 family protein [Novosphingobium pokkalii]|uniref:DUF2322 family protein n=1 Tax=Novosphingobium pokkalii TaxID=1770194 RepID=A0ABV7V2I1_9SPHN|nr:DUF2322 family protein [Novosphingobium pokkalii]GHC83459.1 hypothetical protein GCM10019060_02980 [Novosphingobium pokkalii]
MPKPIEPGPSFRENLALLPEITGVARIDLRDGDGAVVASIPNEPGKQGSVAVYQYLAQQGGVLDAQVAAIGLALFAEHVPDAQARPGAHPNVDRLLAIAYGAPPLHLAIVAA